MESNLPPPNPSGPPPLMAPPRLAAPPRKSTGWKIAALILAALLALSLFSNLSHLFHSLVVSSHGVSRASGPRLEESILENNDSDYKIAVVSVEGIISSDMFDRGNYSMVDYIKDQLKIAERDDRVKAVVLKVNSPGGEVLASDDIYNAIAKFQTNSAKPVVASMGSLAASGGYYVSAPCRWIVANEMTITGSIGVILHSFNYRGLMDKIGLRPEVYKSGKYKDMLSGDKKDSDITAEEREMVQNLINETFGQFTNVVARGREQASQKNKNNSESKGRTLSGKWLDYADGRVLSGREAFELGFVDELGTFDAAVKRAQKLAKISNANLIEYQQMFDLSNLFRLFGKSEATRIKVDLGLDTPRLKAGQLYFLSPAFVH
jgi:protease IV